MQQTFYLQPKIHKVNNPGRPIISACSCPLEQISEYSDVVLQPLVRSLPTDIKTASMPSTWLKVSTKAQTLTEVFVYHGCHIIVHMRPTLMDWKHYSISSINVQLCTHLLILWFAMLNLFWPITHFLSEVFSQMNGVVMGTKLGPSYACLSSWDNWNKNYSNSPANQCLRCSKHNQWW